MGERVSSVREAEAPSAYDELPPRLRPSIPLQAVARILSADASTVRKLIRSKHLDGHRVGKRSIRVYVDSVDAYQRGNPIGDGVEAKDRPKRGARTAAQREAVAALDRMLREG